MKISNSFFVQVIEDGSTLRGEIRATKPLAQAYSDGTCVPNWTVADNQPIVYVVLQNGASWVLPDANYQWYYNGQVIQWDEEGKSLVHASGLAAGTFEKVENFTPDMYSQGQYVPAIKICKNVASDSNVDIDVIRFDGFKTLSTNAVPFSAQIDITITELIRGGYAGFIYLAAGTTDKDISSPTDTVGLVARLFDSSGNEMTSDANGVKYEWFINDTVKVPKGTTNTLTVTEADVYDYAIVKVKFYIPKDDPEHPGTNIDTLVATDYLEVDDTQDPEEMYFAYNGANGKAASLRAGESVTFNIWVGDAGNPSPSNVNTAFNSWQVLLVDSNKQALMQALSSYDSTLKNADQETGYRPMVDKNKTPGSEGDTNVESGIAKITIPFAVACLNAAGESTSGGIRGYVQAQTT